MDVSDGQVDAAADGAGPDPHRVRELLVIRPGGMGDVVRSIPALRLLRSTYPHARLTIVAEERAHPLLAACPWVDRLVNITRPSEAIVEPFDVALSWASPDEPRTLAVDDVDARFRVAWQRAGAGSRNAMRPEWPPRLNDETRMVRLAWLLGGEATDVETPGPSLWPSLADRHGAARHVAEVERPLAVLHPGASHADRRWQQKGWARTIDLLEQTGVDPVLVGTVADRSYVLDVLDRVVHAPLSLIGRTTVGELVGLLERAVLFVGSDSGPAALAQAVGARSLVIGPRDGFEHRLRPGRFDAICPRMSLDMERMPPAGEVPIEVVLARVELAALTAVDRWKAEQIA